MRDKVKIDIVFTRYSPPFFKGGVETYISYLDANLRAKGIDTRIIAMDDKYDYQDKYENIIKVKIWRVPVLAGLWFQKRIKNELDKSDLINIHYPTFGAMQFRKPTILTLHGIASDKANFRNRKTIYNILRSWYRLSLMKILEDRTFKKVDAIICLNDLLKEQLLERNVPSEKIFLIRNGVDTKKFSYVQSILKKHNTNISFLYVGRFIHSKNILKLLEAFKSKDFSGCYLEIVGVGPLENQIKRIIDSKELQHINISFLGYKSGDELVRLYQNCDYYVLPSFYEGLPFTLLEAMACGKPAIVGSFANADVVVKDQQNGFIIPEENIDSIREVLKKAITNKNRLGEMSISARQHIEDNFSMRQAMENTISLFKEIVELNKK